MTPASPVLLRTLTATVAVACCSLAAAAGARANSVVWNSPADQAPASITPPGIDAYVSDQVLAAPNGSVLVFWGQADGPHMRIRANRLSPSGGWDGPEWVSPAGIEIAGTFAATDDDSNFTIGWLDTTRTPSVLTLRTDETRWDVREPVVMNELDGTSGEALTGGAIARGHDGTVIGAYSDVSALPHRIRTVTRARNSNDWTRGLDINVGDSEYPIDLRLSANPAGDVTLLWTRDDGNKDLRMSQRRAGSSTWSAPQTVVENAASNFNFLGLASGPHDDAAVVWQNGDLSIKFTTLADAISDGPDDPSVPPVVLNTHDPESDAVETAVLPNIASNGDGRYTVVFQRNPVSPAAFARTRALDGTWSDPVVITGTFGGGAPKLAANPRGDLVAVFAYSLDGSTYLWGSSSLLHGSDTWTAPTTIGLGNDLDNGSHGLLVAGIDDDGNTAFAFPKPVSGHWEVGFAAGDGAGPVLATPDIPASGTVDETLSFVSGAAYDLRSALGDTTWDFGDGGSATGASVSHSYAAAGSYTVTITSTDAVGNATSRTGTVTVTDPPPPPAVKETVKLPPVIPALLAGKKITITTSVPSCNAKFVAVTKFGTTKYQTKLKLTKTGSGCVGTGTTVLKKAPGARTKLRVAIGRVTSKGIVTVLTLTTRRS